MQNKFFHNLCFFSISLFIAGVTVADAASSSPNIPLIPRKILFANPEKAAPQLSSDGSKIGYLAPDKRILNVWIADVHDIAHAKQVTHETKRSLRNFVWTYNKDYLLYLQDYNGDENFHLYSVNLRTKKIRDLTPFPKVHVQPIKMSPNFPNEMLIGLNNRNAMWHDVYRLNFVTGKMQLVEKNNQFDSYLADEQLKLRVADKPTKDNAIEYYFRDKSGRWQFYTLIPFEDALSTGFNGFNKDGTVAYLNDSRGRDTAALYAFNMATKKQSLVAASDHSDIADVLVHPTELIPQAYATEYTKLEWKILDQRLVNDFAYLKKAVPKDFGIVGRSLADDKWIVWYYSDTKPSSFYLYERDPKTSTPLQLTFLFTTLPVLENQPLVTMQPVIIQSRDGYNLISYLTLPATVPTNNNIPIHPIPLVLDVHGGPWGVRDSWGLNRTHQWLANRGYAVLSVNYRMSAGFGKKFANAGNREWGGKMHTDILDAVNWAIKNHIADPKKIAIMGGSYGGYESLVGLTFTPDVFCCGVSIVGVSNLLTFVKTIPPYWKPDIALIKKRVGDFDTVEGRALLKSRSPLTYADKIVKPLLILQGEHDPRVNKAEAEQIVNKMKHKGIPVTYVLYHNEGHGFSGEANQISSNAIIELFLAANLGGRAEPMGDDFKGANFSIVEGAQYIDALKNH